MDRADPVLIELQIGDAPEAWSAAGFAVQDGRTRIGAVDCWLVGPEEGRGIRSWALTAVEASAIDGLPLHEPRDGESGEGPSSVGPHPNGVVSIDHLVIQSPDLERTTSALEDNEIHERRRRTTDSYGAPMVQVFARLGEVILELIGAPEATGTGAAGFFGLAFTTDDLDTSAELLGDRVGQRKPAVQPERDRRSFDHRAFDISVPILLMSA